MEKVSLLREYNGEIISPSDGVENRGAAWYAYFFNNMKIDYTIKKYKSTQAIPPRHLMGIEIPAIKFHKMNDYVPRFFIKEQNLSVKYQLGRGTYCSVWMAELGNTEKIALKQFDLKKVKTATVWKERDILIHLKHKRILNIQGAFFFRDAFLVLDLCYGTLRSVMSQVNKRNAVRFAVQLAEALHWCHGKNIIHCDLKPDNVLVTTSNDVVISDFGQAIIVPQGTLVVKSKETLGVYHYQDYESNTDFTYSFLTDMFSFGCILYELVTHHGLMQYPVTANQSLPHNQSSHEMLKERVAKTTSIFAPAITPLIDHRATRWNASTFLESAIVANVLHTFQVSRDSIDNDCTEMVTIEQKRMQGTTFSYQWVEVLNDAIIAAFHRFYYDEKEVYGETVTRKALVSYDAHVVASFIKSTNALPALIEALKNNDPVANAQLFNLVRLWIGQRNETKQCSSKESFHQISIVPDNTEEQPDDIVEKAVSLANLGDNKNRDLNQDEKNNELVDDMSKAVKTVNNTISLEQNKTTSNNDSTFLSNEENNVSVSSTSQNIDETKNAESLNPGEFTTTLEHNKDIFQSPGITQQELFGDISETPATTPDLEKREDTSCSTKNNLENVQLENTGSDITQQGEFSDSQLEKQGSGKFDKAPPKKKARIDLLIPDFSTNTDDGWEKADDEIKDPTYNPTAPSFKRPNRKKNKSSQRTANKEKKTKGLTNKNLQTSNTVNSTDSGSQIAKSTEVASPSSDDYVARNNHQISIDATIESNGRADFSKEKSPPWSPSTSTGGKVHNKPTSPKEPNDSTNIDSSNASPSSALSTALGSSESSGDDYAWACPFCSFEDDSESNVAKHIAKCKESIERKKKDKKKNNSQ